MKVQAINTDFAPNSPEQYYAELTTRNRHFILPEVQKKLSELKILIAGCGAGGGACTVPLARLGVTHFRLTDNGLYELSNLNRQHFFSHQIGLNKAQVHQEQILGVNPFADVQSDPQGITRDNVRELVQWADLVLDGVDVTTPTGMEMKLLLHSEAKAAAKPVFSPLDVGFCQAGISFDYRKKNLPAIGGHLERAKRIQHPLKALFEIFPLEIIPAHTLPLVNDLLEDATVPASQLAMAADLLSATFASAVVRFAATGEIIAGWNIDLAPLAMSWRERLSLAIQAPWLRLRIRKKLKTLP